MQKKIKFLIQYCLVAFAMTAGTTTLNAAAPKTVDFDAMYDLELDESLDQPKVNGDKTHRNIVSFQGELANKLYRNGYLVETMRNSEIVIVSIPCDQLFLPNDTILLSEGKKRIKPITEYLKNPGFYKMLLVMNSDNTGSETYTLNLTRARVNAVFDWMEDEKINTDYVVPYAVGGTRPREDMPNNSMANRRDNRRLEIYLVPFDWMIEQGKKGKIDFNKKPKK